MYSWAAVFLLTVSAQALPAADTIELLGRRQRAAEAFQDGILLVHAKPGLDTSADGFRQDAVFFYFTGLENTAGAVLAIDGRSRQSWLFLPTRALYSKILPPEGSPGSDAVKQSGIEHVVDWSEMESFLAKTGSSTAALYYLGLKGSHAELPPNLTGQPAPEAPLWAITIGKKWPSFQLKEVGDRVYTLMDVQSPSEMISVRAAAKATVQAVMAGMRAIRPGVSQRSVEAAVANACWQADAHGVAFWPWAMAGANAVFPRPFASLTRYDHLNAVMKPGDLVRLDVGCASGHYGGDLGRTVPVSGRYSTDQREIWEIFVAAYHAGVRSLRAGSTIDQVFEGWRSELVRQHGSAKSILAQNAIEAWSKRENVPDWQLHTVNVVEGRIQGPLRAGSTIAFEPIASLGGLGFYLEDMFLITNDGAELLTAGVPYSSHDIEAMMRVGGRARSHH
jgi:Xaa-Pro aminopeptidase